MNDMNETLAEIRRRGAERIRARKQTRNRVIALCVPLVLCVTALLVMPEFGQPTYVSRPVETIIPVSTQTHTMPTVQDAPNVVLTVTGKGFSRSYTDVKTFNQLQALLNTLVAEGRATSYVSDQSAVGTFPTITENTDGLHLTVYDHGESREYILYANAIFDESENLCYCVSSAQYNLLLDLLELP